MQEITDLLRAFIEDDRTAMAENRHGKFWTRNHKKIRAALPKLSKALPEEEWPIFYCHYLRRNHDIPAVPQKQLFALIEGYRLFLPHLDGRFVPTAFRLKSLFCFGFDQDGALPSGSLQDATILKERVRLLMQCNKYTTLPAQRAKAENFVPFIPQAQHCLDALRYLNYRHEKFPDPETYNVYDFTLWGMIMVLLLSEDTREQVITDLRDPQRDLPRKDEHLEILDQTIADMGLI